MQDIQVEFDVRERFDQLLMAITHSHFQSGADCFQVRPPASAGRDFA